MRFVRFSHYTHATSLHDNRLDCITDTKYYCLLERNFSFVYNLYLLQPSKASSCFKWLVSDFLRQTSGFDLWVVCVSCMTYKVALKGEFYRHIWVLFCHANSTVIYHRSYMILVIEGVVKRTLLYLSTRIHQKIFRFSHTHKRHTQLAKR